MVSGYLVDGSFVDIQYPIIEASATVHAVLLYYTLMTIFNILHRSNLSSGRLLQATHHWDISTKTYGPKIFSFSQYAYTPVKIGKGLMIPYSRSPDLMVGRFTDSLVSVPSSTTTVLNIYTVV